MLSPLAQILNEIRLKSLPEINELLPICWTGSGVT